MVFNLRTRAPRWAGQPSTFYLLLNALIFTALFHYWSGWAWSGLPAWANSSHEHDDDGHVAPPPPVQQQQPPPPKPVVPAPKIVEPPPCKLPAFCDVCGPEDVWCTKFGRDILARSRAFEGSNTRLRRVIREAQAGKPIKISVLGGSVTRGQGVKARELWFNVFGLWWKSQFPNSKVTLQNGAVAATGTGYMSMCFKEHIDDDSDLVLTEFAINDHRTDGNTKNFEWVVRQLLEMPRNPAVINLQVFGIGYAELTTGGDVHLAVSQYYDTPVVSLRNALLPQLLQNATAGPDWFNVMNGKPDLKHINDKGHLMAAELLAAYVQRQVCAVAEEDARKTDWPRGTSDASQLPLDTNYIPSHRMFQKWGDPPAPILDPFCSSTRTLKHPLTPIFNDGGWENWTFQAKGGTPKTYIRATKPGAKIGFSVPVRGGLGRVRVQYLQSSSFGLGTIKCWLDDDVEHTKYIDGYWKSPLNLAGMSVVSTTAAIGEHTLWCELTGHSQSPDKGTEFRLIGVDSA